MSMDPDTLLLGVDGGGTRCRARLCAPTGARLGEAAAGPANIRFGVVASLAAVLDATWQCLAQAGLGEWTSLLDTLFEQWQRDPHAIVRWTSNASPRDFGTLAPLVVEHASRGDAAGAELMRLAAGHMDALAARLIALGAHRLAL